MLLLHTKVCVSGPPWADMSVTRVFHNIPRILTFYLLITYECVDCNTHTGCAGVLLGGSKCKAAVLVIGSSTRSLQAGL